MPTTVIGNTDLFGADATIMLSSSLSSTCFHHGVSDTNAAIAQHSMASTPKTRRGLAELARLSVGLAISVARDLWKDGKRTR